jgi:hypothetical protein
MAEFLAELHGDRVILTLDPGQPVELVDLSSSFAALARIYERHYRRVGDEAPKLYVTRLETGSVVLEVAPLVVIMGALTIMDGSVIVADFTNRLWRGIKAFSGRGDEVPRLEIPSPEDAADLKAFTAPLLGKAGAALGITHARYEKRDSEKHTIVEYTLDETELNRAAINIDKQLLLPAPDETSVLDAAGKFHSEVMLFLEQANRGPGKEKGRTGDRGVIPDISEKVVPVYFKQSIQGIKERMLRGQENPFSMVFVVTVHAQSIAGEVQGYTVTDIHDSFPRDTE